MTDLLLNRDLHEYNSEIPTTLPAETHISMQDSGSELSNGGHTDERRCVKVYMGFSKAGGVGGVVIRDGFDGGIVPLGK